jgi:hypothetical protein
MRLCQSLSLAIACAARTKREEIGMRRLLTVAGVVLLLAACRGGEEPAPAPTERQAAASPAAASAAPAAPAAKARAVAEANALYTFAYAYPAQAAAIPALAAALDADLAEQRSTIAAEAREAKAESRDADFPFNPYDYGARWSVVTELPGWLSLSGLRESFAGGAHPNHWNDALLWDKQANQRLNALDLFTSKAAFSAAIQEPFCAALNRERAKRRGEPVQPGSGDPFDECIDPADSTIILGSSNKRTFDRIGILIDPYDAGPYVEGDYEVSLPVTAELLKAVRSGYRQHFATGR